MPVTDVRLWIFADHRIHDILDVDPVSTTYRVTDAEGHEIRRMRVFTADMGAGPAQDGGLVVAALERARRLRHPRVPAIHEVGWHEDRLFVVTDDVPGVTMREFAARNPALDVGTAVEIGRQLAGIVGAAHDAGVVHGGINPHTVWVDDAAHDVPAVHLTGFGMAALLARRARDQSGAPALEALAYVAPEQVGGRADHPAADVYALACAVHHLLTGAPPLRDGLPGVRPVPAGRPVSEVREGLSSAVDAVFDRALSPDPEERHPTAAALMAELEQALDSAGPADPGDAPAAIGAPDATRVVATPDARAVDASPRDKAPPEPAAAGAGGNGAPAGPVSRILAEVPDDLFRWDEPPPSPRGSVESRRAERERRDPMGPPVAPTRASRRPQPMPFPAPRRPRPPGRRATAMLVGGLLTAVLGTIVYTALRGPSDLLGPAGGRGNDAEAGRQIAQWTASPSSSPVRSVAVTDAAVVVGAGRDVVGIDPGDGTELWRERNRGKVTDIVTYGDTVVISGRSGVVARDASDGTRRWRSDTPFDTVVAGDDALYAARSREGDVEVATVAADGAVSTLAAVPAGRPRVNTALAYAAAGGRQTLYLLTPSALHAFDPTTGAGRWTAEVGADAAPGAPALRRRPWVRSLAATGEGVVVADRKGRVCGYAARSGDRMWPRCGRFPGKLRRAPAVHADDGVVVVAGERGVAAYDVAGGARLWAYTPSGRLRRPVATAAGATHVAARGGAVRALHHRAGEERAVSDDAAEVTALAADGFGGVYVGRADGSLDRYRQ